PGAGTPPPPLRADSRLDAAIFHLPVERIREGYYSDKYFEYARDVLQADRHDPVVTMQVFQKRHAWLGGVDDAIAVLKLCLSEGHGWDDLEVLALRDGDEAAPSEPVMHITGPYEACAHIETVYFVALARRTKVASNTRRAVLAAWPQPVIFFPARHDHWLVQTVD